MIIGSASNHLELVVEAIETLDITRSRTNSWAGHQAIAVNLHGEALIFLSSHFDIEGVS